MNTSCIEPAIDCSDAGCEPCIIERPTCATDDDCPGGMCASAFCEAPTCSDGIQNQQELDIDCGGSNCPACPTCSDGVRNRDETGIDCGGGICTACPSCSDGVRNQDETGIDCGGATCRACLSCSDGIRNQDETGVDCGGATCPACPCTWTQFGAPQLVTGFGISGDFYGPTLSSDGHTLFLSQGLSGADQIYSATRSDRGTVFSAASKPANINLANSDTTPFLSADGLSLYFSSARAGGLGDRDIMVASRATVSSPFSTPVWLSGVNSSTSDDLPSLTSDELRIVFTSTRAGGQGDADLWTASRARRTDGFATPTNLAELNSSYRDASPNLSSDALTIYFISSRSGGLGNFDIWFATRPNLSSQFSTPQNLSVVNHSAADLDPFLSSDGQELLFSSSRSGKFEIWQSVRQCL